MDSTANNQGINGTHPQQGHHDSSYNSYVEDMRSFPAQNESGPTDYTFSWDPALFAAENISYAHQTQQQPQPRQQNFNQAMTRPTNSNPALPQFQHTQNPASPFQGNFQSHQYEARSSSQPSFDDRFLARPSNSPVSFDNFHHYQPPIQFNGQQHYQQPQPQYQQPQRQNSATNNQFGQGPHQQHAQQQQSLSHYMNIAPARPSAQQQQMPGPSSMFHQFQTKPIQHSFVDPSLLTANGLPNSQQRQPVQHQQPSQYYQLSHRSGVDPQFPEHTRLANVSPASGTNQMLMQPNLGTLQPNALQSVMQSGVYPVKQAEADLANKLKAKATEVKKEGVAGGSASPDELQFVEEAPEPLPAILCVAAPTEFRSKVLYSIVQAVWSPRNKPATPEKVRSGVAAYGETIRQLRDAWKEKNEALKKAELPNSAAASEVPILKNDVAQFRSTMETAMQRSMQYGHDSIIKRLGENHFTLSALYSIMLDRVHAGDWDSSLVTSIFKLAVKFDTLDEEMLETVKWSKILQRLSKKATNESKDLAKQILSNATAQTAKKKATKEDGPGSPGSRSGIVGVKRARDGDVVLPAHKKVVKQASKPLALQHAERRKALEKENAAKAKADKDGKPSASGVVKTKVAVAAPVKTSAFAGLLSASKKPGTSIAEKAAAAAKDKLKAEPVGINGPATVVKREEVRKPSPPRGITPTAPVTKSTSSFLGLLAEMEKPKEPEVKKVKDIPNETEEERSLRLRKEARRKLRVTWKPDSDLVETRLFTHDPDEETGHADSMMRDAGDTGKEGEMLKLHRGIQDLDDDDDEDEPDASEWTMPSEVDFSDIDQERAINFIKFGGPQVPTSSASEGQDKYEENTLMATYTFKSDRPDTPKELPSVHEDDDFSPIADFGEPEEKVRHREKEIIARRQPPPPTPKDFDLAAQLRGMTQQPQQPQATPGGFDIQQTLNLLSQQNQQAPAPVPASTSGGFDLAKLLAVVQQANHMHQGQPPPPQPHYNTPQPPGISSNLAAIVAQVQQGQSLPTGAGGNPNPFPGNGYSRKHDRGDDMESQGKRKKSKVPMGPDGKPLNYKTQVCSFYQEGKCIKGDNCTYRHDE